MSLLLALKMRTTGRRANGSDRVHLVLDEEPVTALPTYEAIDYMEIYTVYSGVCLDPRALLLR